MKMRIPDVSPLLLLMSLPFLANSQKVAEKTIVQGSYFNFLLEDSCITSAGVYTKDSVLLRTLWSGKAYGVGKHQAYWDGMDDEGNLVEAGNYEVRILSNNVKYIWEGVIGNTSDSLTGSTVYDGYGRMNGMAIVENTAFFSKAYSEGSPSYAKFNIRNPQQKHWVGLYKSITLSSLFVTSDGINVYWANVFYRDTSNCFVSATKVVDDNDVLFSKGSRVVTKLGGEFKSAIDIINNNNGVPTGLAVQKKGRYLLVGHGLQNKIHVLDKVSGELIQIIAMANCTNIAIDNNDDVWISYKEDSSYVVKKFGILANGQLSKPTITLKNIEDPLAIAVSPNNKLVIVADGGNNQQLKAFNNETGVFEWVFGKQGGYFVDPAVSFDKFYFTDKRPAQIGTLQTFIAFESDGTFWVEDAGNCRAIHYTADRKFIEQIMYLPSFYSCVVDPNNASRLFANYLEFNVDYSKPLAPNNGSWQLVKNWGATVPDSLDDHFDRFASLTTLQNGRTYALFNTRKTGSWQLAELAKEGPLRFTGINIPGNLRHTRLHKYGALRTTPRSSVGKPLVWTQRKLVGFDKYNNPIWGDEEVFAKSPPFEKEDPASWGYGIMHAWEVSSTGVLVSFDNGIPPYGGTEYHLGGLNTTTYKWVWKTARVTYKNYKGNFPDDGAYDIGNGAHYGGSLPLIYDRNIFWGYHGEFWKNGQVNKWNQVWDDGLFIGQFGATLFEDLSEAPPRMAGNVLSADVVQGKNGGIYLYHNDEGRHGGVHRWKINGLNTIFEQNVPVVKSNSNKGLLVVVYNDTGFNNLKISGSFSVQTNDIAPNFKMLAKNTLPQIISAKFYGFVKALSTELYTFYTGINQGNRLFVNGKLLVDNYPANKKGVDSGSLFLTAGKQYALLIEVKKWEGNHIPQLSWGTSTISKQPIPLNQLIPYEPNNFGKPNIADLMEGLQANAVLENGLNGWARKPSTEDSTNRYKKWWSVSTGAKKNVKFESPDVFISRLQDSGNAEVSRNLGNNFEPISKWRLYGKIGFDKNLMNTRINPSKEIGGCYFEILDINGKILLRFYTSLMHYPDDVRIYLNNQIMLQCSFADFKRFIEHGNAIDISFDNGKLTVRFENLPPVNIDSFEVGGNLEKPEFMRMNFLGNSGNARREIDLEGFYFEK